MGELGTTEGVAYAIMSKVVHANAGVSQVSIFYFPYNEHRGKMSI